MRSDGARNRRALAGAIVLAAWGTAAWKPAAADAAAAITVHNGANLAAALRASRGATVIRLQAGDYALDEPLVVPDGTVLEGPGAMDLDRRGLPRGMGKQGAATLRAARGFTGDLLTLGDGVILRRLRIVDLQDGSALTPRRTGNVLAVGSRRPGDRVVAEVQDCEILSPNTPGSGVDGPTGRALLVLTRNPGPRNGVNPAPHEGAAISVRVERSLVRTRAGTAIFAANLASRGRVLVTLQGNRMEGSLDVIGGLGRPDVTRAAETRILSIDNVYLDPGGSVGAGWQITGGTGPVRADLKGAGAESNLLLLESTDDRINGFPVAIAAAGARRAFPASGASSGNRVDLRIDGLQMHSAGAGAADLVLYGARAGNPGEPDQPGLVPGNDNRLLLQLRDSTGSGRRANRYSHLLAPGLAADMTAGNGLAIAGGSADFQAANAAIDTPPDRRFFSSP